MRKQEQDNNIVKAIREINVSNHTSSTQHMTGFYTSLVPGLNIGPDSPKQWFWKGKKRIIEQ
jgi:hypothetical protein